MINYLIKIAKWLPLGILFFIAGAIPLNGQESAAPARGAIIWLYESQVVPENVIGELRRPSAVEIDYRGNLYIADSGNNRVLKLDKDFRISAKTSGWGSERDLLDSPSDLTTEAGLNIYIADYRNGRIVRLDGDLNFLWSSKLSSYDEFWELPYSLVLSDWGELFILEETSGRIIRLEPSSNKASIFGGYRPGNKNLSGAKRLTIDDKGRLYLNIPAEKSIVRYDRYGNYIERRETVYAAETIDWGDGYLWIGGEAAISCMSDTISVKVKFIGEGLGEQRGDIIDLAVSGGRLALLCSKKPYLRVFQLSKSPSGIQW